MDVINAEQARIAEEAGACAVMALERVPADIRKNGKLFSLIALSHQLISRKSQVVLPVCLIPK
jgi:pyridoxal biosynthesis lyase PdxS